LGWRRRKRRRNFSDSSENRAIIEGSANTDLEAAFRSEVEVRRRGEKKSLKKFFRSSENRVIIEGFADRSEVKREAGC
jgi:hypothetical protein